MVPSFLLKGERVIAMEGQPSRPDHQSRNTYTTMQLQLGCQDSSAIVWKSGPNLTGNPRL